MKTAFFFSLLALALLPACGDDEPDYDCELDYIHSELRPFCNYQPGSWWHYRCASSEDTIRLEVISASSNSQVVTGTPGECSTTFSDRSTDESIRVVLRFYGAFQSDGEILSNQRSATEDASIFDLRLTNSSSIMGGISNTSSYRNIVYGFAPDFVSFKSNLHPNGPREEGRWKKDTTIVLQGTSYPNSWYLECNSDTVVALNRIHWSREDGIVQFGLAGQTFTLVNHNVIR